MKQAIRSLVKSSFWIDKFEVDLRENCGNDDFRNVFSYSFSKADSSSTKERAEAHWMPLFSTGSQVIWRSRVKPLGNVNLWWDPLFRVMVNVVYIDRELLIFNKFRTIRQCDAFCDLESGREPCRGFDSKWFVYAIAKIVAIIYQVLFHQNFTKLLVRDVLLQFEVEVKNWSHLILKFL